MDFQNLLQQLESDTEVSAIMKHDHESLIHDLKDLIPNVSQLTNFAIANGNTFASRKYASLNELLTKAISELESTRV